MDSLAAASTQGLKVAFPSGYFRSLWPAEDAGPQRLQQPWGAPGLNLQAGERLACTTRNTLLSTMTVLGDPGQVYLLSHSALRAHLGFSTTACVEMIDPLTLKTLCASPRLPGGPMWPGGMAIHANGDLYVVYGRHAHRLSRACEVRAHFELPVAQAYNSFVILDNGLLVTKNLSDQTLAQLTVLTPDLHRACADTLCPEPSIARLSSQGNTVYVVGVSSVLRYHWRDEVQALVRDEAWQHDYLAGTTQSYGWDAVIDSEHAWFMDNGRHNYRLRMIGAGLNPSPNRLIRVALHNAQDHHAWEVSGLPFGSITNPPLVDRQTNTVIAYDSANRVLRAWRMKEAHGQTALAPLWQKMGFGCASHMILYPDSGELVLNDYRRWGEEVVVLDIASGTEKARVRSGGLTQGVVFPSVGWQRDVYWCSMGRLARIFVQ
jgi:hypothetical protein